MYSSSLNKLFFILLLLFQSQIGLAETEVKVPPLSGAVVDEVGLLKPLEREQLERMLLKMYETSKIQMAVLITSSLQGFDIESFSIAVVENWKLGRKGQDQGLLMVVAPRERRMRLEVGYGLEGDLPDAYCRQVLDGIVVPYFRKQRFGEGLMVATEAISKKIGLDLSAPVKNRVNLKRESSPLKVFILPLIFFFFWAMLFLRGMFFPFGAGRGWYHSRHGGYGSGGGFGGGGFGGFSGGGGGFGGGGASSSW